jgi:hypothetical protein
MRQSALALSAAALLLSACSPSAPSGPATPAAPPAPTVSFAPDLVGPKPETITQDSISGPGCPKDPDLRILELHAATNCVDVIGSTIRVEDPAKPKIFLAVMRTNFANGSTMRTKPAWWMDNTLRVDCTARSAVAIKLEVYDRSAAKYVDEVKDPPIPLERRISEWAVPRVCDPWPPVTPPAAAATPTSTPSAH